MSPTPPKQSFAKKLRQFFAWSFSRFCDYRDCPAKAAYKHIDRLAPYAQNDAEVNQLVEARTKGKIKELPANTDSMIKGSVVHVMAEQFNKGRLKSLPAELTTFKKEFVELKKYTPSPEQQWAFKADWTPTSWYAKDAWLRMILDAHYPKGDGKYKAIDYKTGKAPSTPDSKTPSWNNEKFYQHQEQREIYAIGIFIMYPDAVEVSCEHWYVDAGVEHKDTYTREKDFERLKLKWLNAVRPMMADRSFVPKPSPSACKFCQFKKADGGPCKY